MILGPKLTIADDEFGWAVSAKAVANLISDRPNSDGYVLGIEGNWGSGKTTFANFVQEEIQEIAPHQKILEFQPWLIGNQSAILPLFFAALAHEIEKIEKQQLNWLQRLNRWRKRSLPDRIKKYGAHVGVLSVPVGALAPFAPTTAAVLAGGIRILERIKGKFFREKTPQELKSEITQDLIALGKRLPALRFIVVLDDTDRLEPSEAVEVLRLVRQVGNFPLISYLVCFDRDVLATQITTALHITRGHEYLDKIFEIVVPLPPQEPFALRRYLKKSLPIATTPADEINLRRKSPSHYRVHLATDVWAGRLLKTPRDVSRLIQTIESGWRSVPENSDLGDFVWLQLVRLKAPDLYSWVREYVANLGAYRDGGQASEREALDAGKRLHELLSEFGWGEKSYESGIGEFLPGISGIFGSEQDKKVYQFTKVDLAMFEAEYRLGSPSHWRQYFSFDVPSYVVRDEEVNRFKTALVENEDRASEMLLSFAKRPHERRGHFASVLLDRLFDQKHSLSAEQLRGLVGVFSNTLDEVATIVREFDVSGRSQLWFDAIRLMSTSTSQKFIECVGVGIAINWLSSAVRDQGFAHGLTGHEKSERTQWLTAQETRECVETLVERYKKLGLKLFLSPSPLDMLFVWSQLGDVQEARNFVARYSENDADFLIVLKGFRGWVNSSDSGIGYPLRREYMTPFMDADEAKSRLRLLIGSKDVALAEESRRLLIDWTDKS